MATAQRHTKRSVVDSAAPDPAVRTDPAAALSLGAQRVVSALADAGHARNRDEWLAVVGDCQSLINTLTAVQDTAIAEAARRESVWCEDGTLGETVHVHGRVTLDAADVLAPLHRGVALAGAAPRRAGGAPGRATGAGAGRRPRPARAPAAWVGCTRR